MIPGPAKTVPRRLRDPETPPASGGVAGTSAKSFHPPRAGVPSACTPSRRTCRTRPESPGRRARSSLRPAPSGDGGRWPGSGARPPALRRSWRRPSRPRSRDRPRGIPRAGPGPFSGTVSHARHRASASRRASGRHGRARPVPRHDGGQGAPGPRRSGVAVRQPDPAWPRPRSVPRPAAGFSARTGPAKPCRPSPPCLDAPEAGMRLTRSESLTVARGAREDGPAFRRSPSDSLLGIGPGLPPATHRDIVGGRA